MAVLRSTLAAILILFCAAGCQLYVTHEVINDDVAFHLRLFEKKPLAELAEKKITLYACREEKGMYADLIFCDSSALA